VAGAADDIGHYLVVVEGNEPGKRIELDSAALTIGRDAKQATMVFPDTGVSRVHAMVRVVNGKAVVEDLNQRTGRLSTPRAWRPERRSEKATSSEWARTP
jgi:pSer/pThr/pTyr-binding forkhead associated (FHA) protein